MNVDTSQLGMEVLEDVRSCGEHAIDLRPEEIATTIAARQWCACSIDSPCDCFCDSEGVALYLLKDGHYATVSEWSDTSGHGCRCGGTACRFATRDEAVRLGLDAEQAEKLGLSAERTDLIAAVESASPIE